MNLNLRGISQAISRELGCKPNGLGEVVYGRERTQGDAEDSAAFIVCDKGEDPAEKTGRRQLVKQDRTWENLESQAKEVN